MTANLYLLFVHVLDAPLRAEFPKVTAFFEGMIARPECKAVWPEVKLCEASPACPAA